PARPARGPGTATKLKGTTTRSQPARRSPRPRRPPNPFHRCSPPSSACGWSWSGCIRRSPSAGARTWPCRCWTWRSACARSRRAAARTFDVALAPMSAALNRQESALTPDQRAIVDAHAQLGVELLQVAGMDDPVWLEAIANHHERLDGSGYPRGLQGNEICRGARLLAIVDIYSAMVRPRAWREAVHARHALRSLFLERGRLV